MDMEKIEYHIRGLLEAIGENPDREGLVETPSRVAGMLAEGVWLLKAFYKQTRWAGNLMIPYMIWIAFATYLTGAFWLLNR